QARTTPTVKLSRSSARLRRATTYKSEEERQTESLAASSRHRRNSRRSISRRRFRRPARFRRPLRPMPSRFASHEPQVSLKKTATLKYSVGLGGTYAWASARE